MKEINLTKDYVAYVDDEDYEYLNQFRWAVKKFKLVSYAVRRYKTKEIFMHRDIMNHPCGLLVDHKDHNGLNNQKSNLRTCTRRENSINRRSYGKSKYLGVSIFVVKRRYKDHVYYYDRIMASIQVNGKKIVIGFFKNERDAAIAYDNAAIKYHGEFANLNYPKLIIQMENINPGDKVGNENK